MTNATVTNAVKGVEGRTLDLSYSGGKEKKICDPGRRPDRYVRPGDGGGSQARRDRLCSRPKGRRRRACCWLRPGRQQWRKPADVNQQRSSFDTPQLTGASADSQLQNRLIQSRRALRTWIKDPLAILADDAERGIVVEGAQIVECVSRAAVARAHRRDVQRLAPCRAAGAHQRASSFLPDADARPSRRPRQGAHSLARDDGARLGPHDARGAAPRDPDGAGRAHAFRLHDRGRPSQSLSPDLKNAIDIEVEEATKLGLRMTVTRGSMGISEKDGGLQPDSIVQDSETILEDSERVLRLYHDPKPGAMIRVALAPCSPLAVPKRVMEGSAELAERYDCRLHTHLCQSLDEDVYAVETFGMRSVDLLEEAGWLRARALGRARDPFQRERDRAPRQRGRQRLPLRRLRHGLRHGGLPDQGARGGGRRRSALASTARPRTIRRT